MGSGSNPYDTAQYKLRGVHNPEPEGTTITIAVRGAAVGPGSVYGSVLALVNILVRRGASSPF